MSRNEDSHRSELINAINLVLDTPLESYTRAYDTQMFELDISDQDLAFIKAKEVPKEFDIVIVNSNFVTGKKIDRNHIDIAIETKSPETECNGISKVDEVFSAFPMLTYAFATNFGNKLYCKARFFPEETIELESTDMKAKHIEIAEIIELAVSNVSIALMIGMHIRPTPISGHFIPRKLCDSFFPKKSKRMELDDQQKKILNIPIDKDMLQRIEEKMNKNREELLASSKDFEDFDELIKKLKMQK